MGVATARKSSRGKRRLAALLRLEKRVIRYRGVEWVSVISGARRSITLWMIFSDAGFTRCSSKPAASARARSAARP